MHVDGCGLDPQLEVDQAAQRVGDGGKALRHHGGVTDDAVVGLKAIAVGSYEFLEMRAADLFFAFGDDLQVEGQLTGRAQPGRNRLPVQRDLALVVRRATAPEQPVLLAWLKRR